MSWSWKIGRIAGIPVFIHWTFLILLGWFFIAGVMQGESVGRAGLDVLFILSLFGCVVLHELGHALTARRFGVPTADITLLPIGGVARLQRIPENPTQELLIAIAGPLVNVGIAAVLLAIGVRPPGDVARASHLIDGGFGPRLLELNLFLVAFNLLPAFPMDGGRILRALLAMKLDYAKATRMAASIGQVMAIGFGLLGLTAHAPLLMLIALFVWIGAEGEAKSVEERVVLRDVPVRDAMITEFHSLSPSDSLGQAAEVLLAGSQQDFPVLSGDSYAGVLTRNDLFSGLSQGGREASIAPHVKPELPPVEAGSPLVAAVARLREGGLPCLRVVDGHRTVGLLTLENVGEFLMVRSALSSAPGGQAATPVLGRA